MLQARLELAPRVNPDWILSPTRLPIPPLERKCYLIVKMFFYFRALEASTSLSSDVTFSHLLVGRVPLERKCYLIVKMFFYFRALEASTSLSSDVTFSHLLVGRVPLELVQNLELLNSIIKKNISQ